MTISMSQLQSEAEDWLRRTIYRAQGWQEAFLGKPTSSSTWVFDSPKGAGWKWVRIVDGSYTHAYNTRGVEDSGNLKIWVAKDPKGKLEIKDIRI